jgi:predicted acetyltransferase
MTELVLPDVRYRESWADAVTEFPEGTMHGSGVWELENGMDTTEEGCREAVARLRSCADHAVELPENRVHSTYFWITEGDEFVGFLALRHALTPWLLEEGGHIGFSVRPSRRRRGHARRALALALTEAKALGLDRVLLTCDEDNDGSRRTIEHNGAVYEDTRKGKRRYWIDLG